MRLTRIIASAPLALVLAAAPAAAQGEFSVSYGPSDQPTYRDISETFQSIGVLEATADWLNDVVTPAEDVTIAIEECGGQVDSFYDAERNTVVTCYEFVEMLPVLFASVPRSERAIHGGQMMGYMIAHNAAHAVIEVGGFVVGDEEDAADELVLTLLSRSDELAAGAARSGLMRLKQQLLGMTETPFVRRHQFIDLRLQYVLCGLYGSAPESFGILVGGDLVPPEQAPLCPTAFQMWSGIWERRLGAALKPR